MKKIKQVITLLLFTVIILSSFVGVTKAKSEPMTKANTIYYATFSDPIDLNPAISSDNASSEVTGFLFRALLKRDWSGKLIPDMAEAMPTISNDNKTITFKLRKGIKWHDGTELTSADIKFSYEFILEPKVASVRRSNFINIDTIETPDKYTVVFKLKEPDSALLPNFSYYYIIPKHIWEPELQKLLNGTYKSIKESKYNREPIGNGPYMFVEWKTAERVVLKRNPNFYDPQPKIEYIVFTITPSQAVAMVKTETGEADYVVVPESDVARMRTKSNLNTFVYDRASFDYIVYNLKHPIFSDKRVRQAIAHALNKEAMVKGIYKGVASVAHSSYHPKLWAYNPNVKPLQYNLNRAKQLLDQAGWKVGKDGIREKNGQKLQFVLMTNKGNIMREKLVVYIQNQLRLVGIKVEPRIIEWNTFLNKYYYAGKYDAVLLGFITSIDGDQTVLFHSDPAKGTFNRNFYKNPQVDKLLDDARKTFDINEQKKLYWKLQEIIAEDQPITYIAYRKNGLSFNKRVKNVKVVDLLGTNDGYMSWELQK
ncbi:MULTISPECIES: peptide-binding protein [Caloramator]|uniref:Oligopeptide ABC transporter, periplasmic oligopeptide-binding protein OppA (TC 3.A.1.5.1) n=1 Tax=Caloramator australicus RC3 TaxID=857293 RepID=G0V4P4_9CLOT|nr:MULTISPECIES: peptide-binding protein [Caloramator]MDO6353592.1 peptide-binding protein [Caloramator sp. CAR-1]CCC58084.1 Oligopeptide ABC transporter, periplasmic oligopeptide-binding protein OppA (TC 3.A.1.5.1) [Caloramator australicus RC3]